MAPGAFSRLGSPSPRAGSHQSSWQEQRADRALGTSALFCSLHPLASVHVGTHVPNCLPRGQGAEPPLVCLAVRLDKSTTLHEAPWGLKLVLAPAQCKVGLER